MKRIKMLFFSCAWLTTIQSYSQNVGIGTTNPLARLHVADSAVLFTGQLIVPAPPPPVSGTGGRLMWYPAKLAFRAGEVRSSEAWNADNIGNRSIAMGYNTTASGDASFSVGHTCSATGVRSIAMGYNALSIDQGTVAIGTFTSATGINDISIGGSCLSWADSSSIVMGNNARAGANYATALGYATIANSKYSTVTGMYNDTLLSTDPAINSRLFIVGNGTDEFNRRNALLIYKNGNTDISGYTRLGSATDGAPRIKTKKISIASGPAINAVQSYALGSGITDAKVLGVQVTLSYAGNWKIIPGYSDTPGYEYNIQIQSNNLVVILKNGNSANIGNKPITALITYEE